MKRQWSPRGVAWLGGAFITVIAGAASLDILLSYRDTVAQTGRELESQSRVLAEQTARSVQAIDVVLRHVAGEFKRGRLSRLGPEELDNLLRELSLGLNQIDGLGVFDARGDALGVSWPATRRPPNMSQLPRFQALRDDPAAGFVIFEASRAAGEDVWIVPFARRLESADGAFSGVVAARGRVDYFQSVYRDAYPDPGSRVALLHRNTSLLARHPPAEEALGKRFPVVDQYVEAAAGGAVQTRVASPIDGVDRFGVVRRLPDYPLTVVVTRDAATALAPWRAQAIGTAGRTLALGTLAGLLLWLLVRQLRRLEEARRSLQATQERFALAVAGSDDGIWVHDFETGRAFNSRRARELVGMPDGPEDIALDEWLAELPRYIHPDDLPGRKAAMEAHLAGRTPIYEADVRHRLPDGSDRWVRIRGVCVRDAGGKPLRMAGSISDVNARIRALERLRESEEHYRSIFNASADALVLRDADSTVVDVNPAFLQMTGLAREEIVGARDWPFALPGQVPAAGDMHRRVIAGESVQIEMQGRRRDGSVIDVELRAVPIRYRGRPHALVMGRDITARKRAEAERASLEGQLLQAKKLEAIGTLAGGIAHDFNNILSAILGYGEMAQKGAAPGTPLKRHVDAVVNAGMRAKSLVERILAFSRSGVGERVPVHVQSVVAEALDLAAASLPAPVRLERRLEAGEAAVLGDPTQIHQVVMNLCANAAQAIKGAGTIAVALESVDMRESPAATSTLKAGRYVRLTVRDSGSGIPPAVLERIFDPFFTTKDIGVGTGLGLSLVHGIVTDLGGGIVVDSRPGEGSTFIVYLPLSRAAAALPAAGAEAPEGEGQAILFVDDEEPLVQLGEEMIASLGYEPVGFASSRTALQAFLAEPQRFSAVLSDESMPEMTGSELAREIRRVRPDLPIVLMTGFVSPALSSRAAELGVAEILAKPLVSGDIARSLAAVLRA